MKQFLKFMLATIVGVFVSGFILMILGIVIFAGAIASSDSETIVPENSVFMLKLDAPLEERSQESPLDFLMGDDNATIGLDDVIASIRKAKSNENIKGIYLDMSSFGGSYATASLQAIRRELLDFKKSGKFLIAYGDQYSQGGYYLASTADKVLLNPVGSLGWHGLSMEIMFLKDAMQKVGVKAQVFRVGTYKSAVEPYIATEMSPANREQQQAFVNSFWTQMLTDVAASRKMVEDSLNAMADRYMDVVQAKDIVKARLADQLMYKDEVISLLKKKVGIDEDDDLELLTLDEMTRVKDVTPKPKDGNGIAVYYAYGAIVDNAPSKYQSEGIVGKRMAAELRELRDNDDIKAVVIRVNSPGGSAFASEQIWREVKRLKEKKPVVVSMGDYAASGGYYISCAADEIFAESNTLTGSIGVFGIFYDASELMTDKLGVHFDGVKTNVHSDLGSMGRPFNADEQNLIQQNVNNTYSLFVSRCAEGRKMSDEAIRRIAEGRVWTGAKAKELKLVDRIGGLDDAIAAAAKKANVKEYALLTYPEKEGMFSSLFSSGTDRYIESRVVKAFGDYYQYFEWLRNVENTDKVQARLPFFFTIR